MDEDRKAMAMQLWQPTTESLKDWTKSMLWFQNNTIQQQRAKFSTDHDNDIKNNFTASVSTTDHSVAKECNTATRIWLVAKWIRDRYNSNDIYDYDGWEDAPLVDAYKSTYPEYEDKIWGFVLDESQICDPSDLYENLWFYWKEKIGITDDTVEDDSPDNFVDRVKNVGKTFLSFFETWWDFVRNAVNWTIWWIEWDQTPWALENYADMNYWKSFYSLTDEQKKEARDAIATQEWMDMYKPSVQRVILKWLEAWLDAAFTIYAPYVKWWFSVWENTPWISDLLEIAWTIMQWGWWLVNHISPLYFYRDTLQTEEEKQEFDSFVGTLWFMKLFQKRWWRTEWNVKETLLKEIDPETTIKEFQKRITDAPADIKEWWINMKYWKPTQENLQDTAWLIVKPKTTEESVMATRALEKLDLEWVKDYVDLDTRFLEKNSEIQNAEDAIYELDTRKFKPEDTSTVKIYEMEWDKYVEEWEWSVVRQWEWEPEKVKYTTARSIDYVQPMIDLLKLFYEWRADKSAAIELTEKKFNTEWLTKKEINELTKEILKEYETYTKRWKPKETIEALDVEAIRKKWKYFARWDDDVLIELDREWSDNMNTQQMVKDLRDEIVRAKSTTVKKNLPQKLMSALWDLLSITWVKSLLFKIIPNAVWEEKINPLTRQKNLSKYIKKFESLNERLNWAKTKKQAEIIVEEFIDEMEKDIWPIEWEVITNETDWQEYKKPNNRLEEVVQSETVYPESRLLWDNGKNNVPQDFTTMPWIDPKWNVFKWFREVQEVDRRKK